MRKEKNDLIEKVNKKLFYTELMKMRKEFKGLCKNKEYLIEKVDNLKKMISEEKKNFDTIESEG